MRLVRRLLQRLPGRSPALAPTREDQGSDPELDSLDRLEVELLLREALDVDGTGGVARVLAQPGATLEDVARHLEGLPPTRGG